MTVVSSLFRSSPSSSSSPSRSTSPSPVMTISPAQSSTSAAGRHGLARSSPSSPSQSSPNSPTSSPKANKPSTRGTASPSPLLPPFVQLGPPAPATPSPSSSTSRSNSMPRSSLSMSALDEPYTSIPTSTSTPMSTAHLSPHPSPNPSPGRSSPRQRHLQGDKSSPQTQSSPNSNGGGNRVSRVLRQAWGSSSSSSSTPRSPKFDRTSGRQQTPLSADLDGTVAGLDSAWSPASGAVDGVAFDLDSDLYWTGPPSATIALAVSGSSSSALSPLVQLQIAGEDVDECEDEDESAAGNEGHDQGESTWIWDDRRPRGSFQLQRFGRRGMTGQRLTEGNRASDKRKTKLSPLWMSYNGGAADW